MFKEKLVSSIDNVNGTVSKVYTAKNYNFLYGIAVIIGGSIVYSVFGLEDSPLILCQQSYMKATNEIVRYNEENPDYKIQLPEYNCSETLLQKNATGGKSPVPLGQEVEELTLRDRFGLGDCRFINDFHRIGKYNLEWTAYDIACEVGKSFEVYSPGEYIVESTSWGANLGDYMILRKTGGDVRIVLGHIETPLLAGAIVRKGTFLGRTNISGASTNYHIHIELWDTFYNVSREFALDKPYKKINGTALLNHRQWDFGQQKKNVYYFTSYNLGDVKQNDNAPCIGASGKDLCALEKSGVRTMALTSDIRQSLGIKFGDKVRLLGEEGCEGVYEVHDEMNIRFRQYPGVLRPGTPYYIKGDLPSKEGGVCSINKL